MANVEKLLYTRQDAAYMLSISVRAIDYLISNAKIKTRRMGSRVLIPRAEVLRLASKDNPEPFGAEVADLA